MKKKLWLSWSSGKDSAWALHVLRQEPAYEVSGLFTTVNKAFDRVAMHAVRRKLLEAQAVAAELPLDIVEIPFPCSNEQYGSAMQALLERARQQGVTHMAFGDLYLEDIRRYRETMLQDTGITPVFPLFGLPTLALAREMIQAGVRAHLTCIDPRKLPAELAGRVFDESLLGDLPQGTDPCGENGEFHTFVSAGPMLRHSLEVTVGPSVERDGFVFADLDFTAAPAVS
jgi:uncharacterized protein (TIGR00290 family)